MPNRLCFAATLSTSGGEVLPLEGLTILKRARRDSAALAMLTLSAESAEKIYLLFVLDGDLEAFASDSVSAQTKTRTMPEIASFVLTGDEAGNEAKHYAEDVFYTSTQPADEPGSSEPAAERGAFSLRGEMEDGRPFVVSGAFFALTDAFPLP